MKKIFTLLVAGLLAVPSLMAEEVTVSFDFTTEEGLAELGLTQPTPSHGYNIDGDFTKDEVTLTFASPEGATGNKAVKIYTNADGKTRLEIQTNCSTTFSISVDGDKNITKIEMTGFSMRPVWDSGTWVPSGASWTSGVWTGAEEVVSFTASDGFEIYTIAVTYDDAITAVEGINADKAVQSVRYYNLAGQQSNEMMPGMNIVVTNYQDGTQSVSKVIK